MHVFLNPNTGEPDPEYQPRPSQEECKRAVGEVATRLEELAKVLREVRTTRFMDPRKLIEVGSVLGVCEQSLNISASRSGQHIMEYHFREEAVPLTTGEEVVREFQQANRLTKGDSTNGREDEEDESGRSSRGA